MQDVSGARTRRKAIHKFGVVNRYKNSAAAETNCVGENDVTIAAHCCSMRLVRVPLTDRQTDSAACAGQKEIADVTREYSVYRP